MASPKMSPRTGPQSGAPDRPAGSPRMKAPASPASTPASPLMKSATAGREDNLTYDLKHLAAFDMSPLHPKTDLKAYSRDSVQLLVNKIFTTLKRNQSEDGVFVELPSEETFKLPRSKPVPKMKEKSRWEKFMEEKGMKKRKRSRLVWDEASGDWKPRWGYGSVKKSKDNTANWAMEVKPGQDPTANPFAKQAAEKKLLLARQKMREVRNKVEALGGKLRASAPDLDTGRSSSKLKHGKMKGASDRGKDGLREAVRRAQISSASHGKFDRVAPNEATNLQAKRKRKANFAPTMGEERERYMKAANKVFSSDSNVDKDKAAKYGMTLGNADGKRGAPAPKSKRRSKSGGGSRKKNAKRGR